MSDHDKVAAVLNAAKLAGRKTETGYEFNSNEEATRKALVALTAARIACVYVPEGVEHGVRLEIRGTCYCGMTGQPHWHIEPPEKGGR